jgi:hypothetical protein
MRSYQKEYLTQTLKLEHYQSSFLYPPRFNLKSACINISGKSSK